MDPADKAGYARGWVERVGLKATTTELELKLGQEISFARLVAVGTSPLQAVGEVGAFLGEVRGDATSHPHTFLPAHRLAFPRTAFALVSLSRRN